MDQHTYRPTTYCEKCKKARKYLIKGICHACYYGYKSNEMKCAKCGRIRPHRAKMMCHSCYKTFGTPKVNCKICGELKNHKAKGMCGNCFLKRFHYDAVKEHKTRKYHNISLRLYRKVTKQCIICDFNRIVELHHIDDDHNNSSTDNLVGLCPNHHKMIHNWVFSKEIKQRLKEKLKINIS